MLEDEFLTTKELARRWNVSSGSLVNNRAARRGPAFMKVGTSVRYALRDVVAYEGANRVITLDAL